MDCNYQGPPVISIDSFITKNYTSKYHYFYTLYADRYGIIAVVLHYR
jgi:hypothetical protein